MADSPINQSLWDITLPAVRASWAAGREYVAPGNKYVPRISRPLYTENEFGWPSTTKTDVGSDVDRTHIDWGEMFGPAGQQFTYVAIEDVAELQSAIDEVIEAARRDSNFGSCMNPFNHSDDVEWCENHLRFDYRKKIVGAIISRAEATGVTSDADLLTIFRELERARFDTELNGDLVVPVILTDFGSVDRFEIGSGIHVERISEDLQCARAPHALYSREINPYLIAAATHAIVVENITIDNSTYGRRLLGRISGGSAVNPTEMAKVDRAIEAIHILTGVTTGYAQVFVRPDGWADDWTADLPPVFTDRTVSNYPTSHDFQPEWRRAKEPLDADFVAEMAQAYPTLTAAPKHIGLASRRAIRAMMRTDDQDRTVDAMIGVEALLLDNQPELKFRMALRAAAALCEEYDPATIAGLAKNVYDHRSEIAHGGAVKKATFTFNGETWRSADIAAFLLRALLRNYLLSPAPWTKDQLDERVFAALAAYSLPTDV
ncbi:HEPN domain-containing protein [Mycolicibacterium fortuitum]|uniref:HEPN domain-containing protein n=1 Tax=Mycolicibacterium fortuitum TaxID=1766 RepID=UPI001CE13339|nr:HEPN domain-containing protein [Mycolicibacterium fortuitum]MCA4726885.1 hypothetical protein [Mycolicibacterium fortuitum]